MNEELIRGETVVRVGNDTATCRAEGSRIKCVFFDKTATWDLTDRLATTNQSSSFAPTKFMTT